MAVSLSIGGQPLFSIFMKIQKLQIGNFKSLVDLEIVEPNPFTVFVGANGVGKSNIFEALEFAKSNITYVDVSTKTDPGRIAKIELGKLERAYVLDAQKEIIDLIEKDFGGRRQYLNFLSSPQKFSYSCIYEKSTTSTLDLGYNTESPDFFANLPVNPYTNDFSIYKQFYNSFSRLFIGKKNLNRLHEFKVRYERDSLFTSADNLEKVLKRLLLDESKREEIVEYLQLFVPGFENIEIYSDNIGGTDTLLIYEKSSSKPFNKSLISDGTYNLLCLLTAVFQSDEPQFLCIEEPENGLTPDVIKEMTSIFRNACEEKGHYIWLNTHSQSLVSQLTADEVITVDKINGETKIQQFTGKNFHGLRMDEAWLTNSLGSGLPW